MGRTERVRLKSYPEFRTSHLTVCLVWNFVHGFSRIVTDLPLYKGYFQKLLSRLIRFIRRHFCRVIRVRSETVG